MTEPTEPTEPAKPRRKPRKVTPAAARKTYADAALKQGRGFTPDKQAEYLAHLASGLPRGMSAKLAGINYKTVCDYRLKDPAFVAAELEMVVEATEPVQVVLRDLALSGHFGAMTYYLGNMAPNLFEDTRTKKIKHEGTVKHELEAGASMENILRLQAALQERAALRSTGELGPPVEDAEVVVEPD